MRRDAIMEGFWIFQDSEYARFLHMQGLRKVLIIPEYGRMMHEWKLKCPYYGKVLNMPGQSFLGF